MVEINELIVPINRHNITFEVKAFRGEKPSIR